MVTMVSTDVAVCCTATALKLGRQPFVVLAGRSINLLTT
jgi:hypothetical protein